MSRKGRIDGETIARALFLLLFAIGICGIVA